MAETIVTSDYRGLTSGNIVGRLGRSRADGSRGKARMTITIQAEPLVHLFDEVQLGKGPAEAIANTLRGKVEAIAEPVAESTKFTRKYQEAGYARGADWAVERFAGGKIGAMAPRTGELRKFNHSGRFAKSIVATENRTEKNWTVNVAVNRLDPSTSRNGGEFAFITDALRRLVPEIDNPDRLMGDPAVRRALEQSIGDLILDAQRLNLALREQRLAAALGLVRQLASGPLDVLFG